MKPSPILLGLAAVAACALTFLGCEGDYERPTHFESVNALNRPDCRLGAFEGTGPARIARRIFPDANVIVFDDVGEAGASLLGGRLEGFIGAEHVLNVFCRAYPLRFRILDDALERQPSRVLVAQKNRALLNEVNAFIGEYKRKGVYDDMFLRWCLADVYVPMPEIVANGTNGTLRVGLSGLIEPSNFIDSDGNLTGYDVEFALRLGRALGRTVSFQLNPTRKYADALSAGTIDLVIDNWNDPDLPKGIAASDGYFDSDVKVLIAEAQPGLDEKLDALMLEGSHFGVSDVLIPDVRVRLFVNGIVNTFSIALLAALLGFFLARGAAKVEMHLPRPCLRVVDAIVALLRWTPPLVLLLVFNSGILPWAPPWITAVVALAVWFAAFLDPVASGDPIVWLPVVRLRLPALLQWTCVVGYISVFDLTMAVDLVCGRSMKAFVPLAAVAFAYVLMAWLLDRIVGHFERKVTKVA